jgi:rubrerythrin
MNQTDDGASPIVSVPEFLVHALELERESAERYQELSQSMALHSNPGVASLFRRLSAMSAAHAREVQGRSAGLELPKIPPWGFKWQCPGSPEGHCGEGEIHYMMTVRQALEVALLNETRGRDFYAAVGRASPDAEVRALADEMAEEETQHVDILTAWLQKHVEHPNSALEDLDPPNDLG